MLMLSFRNKTQQLHNNYTTITQLLHYIQLFNNMYNHVFFPQDEHQALNPSFIVVKPVN